MSATGTILDLDSAALAVLLDIARAHVSIVDHDDSGPGRYRVGCTCGVERQTIDGTKANAWDLSHLHLVAQMLHALRRGGFLAQPARDASGGAA